MADKIANLLLAGVYDRMKADIWMHRPVRWLDRIRVRLATWILGRE